MMTKFIKCSRYYTHVINNFFSFSICTYHSLHLVSDIFCTDFCSSNLCSHYIHMNYVTDIFSDFESNELRDHVYVSMNKTL